MRLMIVRHGDPDYSIDSLTPKGWKEAELLADRLCKLDIAKFYVSPLGRAKDTASFTLKRLGREAEEMTWMREFDAWIKRPDVGDRAILWDWLPEDWTKVSSFYDKDAWSDHTLLKEGTTEHGDIRSENLTSCLSVMAIAARDRSIVRRMPMMTPLSCSVTSDWNACF